VARTVLEPLYDSVKNLIHRQTDLSHRLCELQQLLRPKRLKLVPKALHEDLDHLTVSESETRSKQVQKVLCVPQISLPDLFCVL
jgi:hypothetical protein